MMDWSNAAAFSAGEVGILAEDTRSGTRNCRVEGTEVADRTGVEMTHQEQQIIQIKVRCGSRSPQTLDHIRPLVDHPVNAVKHPSSVTTALIAVQNGPADDLPPGCPFSGCEGDQGVVQLRVGTQRHRHTAKVAK